MNDAAEALHHAPNAAEAGDDPLMAELNALLEAEIASVPAPLATVVPPVEEVIAEVVMQEEVVAAPEGEIAIEEIVEEPAEAPALSMFDQVSGLEAELLTELVIVGDMAEAYKDQTTSVSIGTPAAPKAARAPKAPRAPKAAGAAPMVRDLSAIPDKMFVLAGSVAEVEAMDATALATHRADTMTRVPGQVKVVEKFENIFIALNAGKLPYNYTVTAFKLLDSKGKATSAEIVAALKANGAGEGTARSQCGQMMALLPAVGIADRTGPELTLRADSTIAERLRALIAASGS